MEGPKPMSCCNSTSADLTFTRGDSGRLDVVVKQADGEPYDLTGATLFLTVKTALSVADNAATISKTVTSHDDAEEGQSHFAIATTDNNTAGTYYYDVQLKDSTAKVYTLFGGLWKVLGDVTTRTS
jgi:hypothetical protein